MTARRTAALTADGSNVGDFSTRDWGLLAATSLIWGSSFLWIALSLDAFHPGAIALLRVVLGAGALALAPVARTKIDRSAWPALLVIAIGGNAGPALLFPFAQQRVESSVAGMMNSTSPVLVLLIAILLTRKAPMRAQVIGLGVGLVGAVLLALPNVSGANAEPLGVLLVMLAVLGYAIANNFMPPLQQTYGGTATAFWALLVSAVMLLPYGIWGLTQSTIVTGGVSSSTAVSSLVAIAILGVLGTGVARSTFANLIGSVGAPRAAMIGYFIPIVAIALGVLVRNESVGLIELGGTVLVLLGARLISRGRQADAAPTAPQAGAAD